MKNLIPLLAVAIMAVLATPARAELCPKHKGMAFTTDIGTCRECKGFTSSGSFKLCKKCSAKLAQCEACGAGLQAGAKPSDPAKKEDIEKDKPAVHRGPNGKEFPAHWGAPPRAQTRDLRPLPGGYGSGSGTLAKWIQMNLDKDTAKEKPEPQKKDSPPGEKPKTTTDGGALVYNGYFVSNKFRPDETLTLALITDKKSFDEVFGEAFVMRDKSKRLPPDAFETRLIATAIRRGPAFHEYRLEQAQLKSGELTLQFHTESRPDASATFACPLIVSVPRADLKSVRFVENGKELASLKLSEK
jgi:hypothetical protein